MDKITSIAISGRNGTGKTTLCTALSERLQWKHVNVGQEFRRLAEQFKLNLEDFGSIPDAKLVEIDKIMQIRMANEDNIIWDGRLSCFLARNRSDIYKICCKANLDIRALRTSTRDNVSITEAKKQILAREEEENFVFKRLYNLDNPYDMQWIDLIIDASYKTPEELVDKILLHIDRK